MREPLWTKNFILLMAANAIFYSSFQLLMPTLPLYFVEHGNPVEKVGIVMGALTFSAIIIRLICGAGLSRFGIKAFLIAGLLISLVSIVLYIWGQSFVAALAVRILHGAGYGISSTLFATLLIDLTPASRRGESIGYLGIGTLVASSFGPFIGVWMYPRWDSIYLFTVIAFTQVCALLLVMMIDVPGCKRRARNKTASVHVLERFVETSALLPAFLSLLLGVCFGSIASFMALFGQESGITNIGWFFFASSLGSFLARIFAGRIFDRKGHAYVIIPGAVAGTIGMFVLSQSATLYHLIAAAACYGLGSGLLFPALQAWILNRTGPERRTEASAMFYNAFDIGIAGGTAVLGFLASVFNYSVMYLWTTFIMFAILVIYLTSRKIGARHHSNI